MIVPLHKLRPEMQLHPHHLQPHHLTNLPQEVLLHLLQRLNLLQEHHLLHQHLLNRQTPLLQTQDRQTLLLQTQDHQTPQGQIELLVKKVLQKSLIVI